MTPMFAETSGTRKVNAQKKAASVRQIWSHQEVAEINSIFPEYTVTKTEKGKPSVDLVKARIMENKAKGGILHLRRPKLVQRKINRILKYE